MKVFCVATMIHKDGAPGRRFVSRVPIEKYTNNAMSKTITFEDLEDAMFTLHTYKTVTLDVTVYGYDGEGEITNAELNILMELFTPRDWDLNDLQELVLNELFVLEPSTVVTLDNKYYFEEVR